MPKRRRKPRKKASKSQRIISLVLMLAGLINALILLLNVPVASINCEGLNLSVDVHRSLSVSILRVAFHPESQYLRLNLSCISMEVIVDNRSKVLATVPLKPSEVLYLDSSVIFNVTNSSLPIPVFIRDNVSHIKYPVALVSSPKRAYIPLSTYLYEAVLEAHISNHGAVISVRTSEPVILQVKLHYTENLSSTKVVGPLSDKDKIYINESFMYIEVEPLIVKGLLYFRVSDGIAELYPTDNLGLFAVLIAVPVTLGIAILRYKKFSSRNY